MADATRNQITIQEVERSLSRRIMESHAEMQARMDQLTSYFDELKTLFTTHSSHVNPGGSSANNSGGPQQENQVETQGSQGGNPRHNNPLPGPYSTRISKIDFPRFDGTRVKEWLYKCEQFFSLDNTPPESKVRLASIHLDGTALQWHLNYMRSHFDIYPTWPQYITDVSVCFGEVYEDPLSTLIQVKQSGNVQDYVEVFELALTQIMLPTEHSLSIFLASLEHNTQMHVRMFNPTSIAQAANLAKLHEASHSNASRFYNRSGTASFKSAATASKAPVVSQQNSQVQANKPIFSKPPRTYNAAEMADRRAKGLCMFCDEPFTPGHQLKHR